MARGQRTIETQDGNEITILFNNFALAEAEQRMGKSVLGVSRDFLNNAAGVSEVAQMLRAGMQAANRANGLRKEVVSLKDAFDVMDKIGFVTCMTTILEAMSDVLMYDGKLAEPDDDTDPN